MGRQTPATTEKIEQEEAFWAAFTARLAAGDWREAERFWEFIHGNRAAVTVQPTANVTEPVELLMAVRLAEREEAVRRQLRDYLLRARQEWAPFEGTLDASAQAALRRLWSYVEARHAAITAHGTPGNLEPVFFSMLLGLGRRLSDLEAALAGVIQAARPRGP